MRNGWANPPHRPVTVSAVVVVACRRRLPVEACEDAQQTWMDDYASLFALLRLKF
jgi:hypothetical protein